MKKTTAVLSYDRNDFVKWCVARGIAPTKYYRWFDNDNDEYINIYEKNQLHSLEFNSIEETKKAKLKPEHHTLKQLIKQRIR